MAYNYNITRTQDVLSPTELAVGKFVCYIENPEPNNHAISPNTVGVLEDAKTIAGGKGNWSAVINGVREFFDIRGIRLVNNKFDGTSHLYGVITPNEITPEMKNDQTRQIAGQGLSTTVSLTYMLPKDYFACEALNALIQKIDDPLGMSDGTIALLAAKCYKIAQAMAIEAYGSRENDKASTGEAGTDYIVVDKTSLQTNTERILYNINEAIKANTKSNKDTGIKINNIDKVKFDGTPTVKLDTTSEVKVTQLPSVTISGTPSVNINNSPDVYIANTPTVQISNSPNVYVANTTANPVNTKEVSSSNS